MQQYRFEAAVTDRVALDAYAARTCGRVTNTASDHPRTRRRDRADRRISTRPRRSRPHRPTTPARRLTDLGRGNEHDRPIPNHGRALREYIALLQEIDERYLGDEWMAGAFGDLPDGFRQIASMLEGGFHLMFELGSRPAVLPPDRDAVAQDAGRQRRRDLLHRAGAFRPRVPRDRQSRRRDLPVVHGREGTRAKADTAPRPRAC